MPSRHPWYTSIVPWATFSTFLEVSDHTMMDCNNVSMLSSNHYTPCVIGNHHWGENLPVWLDQSKCDNHIPVLHIHAVIVPRNKWDPLVSIQDFLEGDRICQREQKHVDYCWYKENTVVRPRLWPVAPCQTWLLALWWPEWCQLVTHYPETSSWINCVPGPPSVILCCRSMQRLFLL